MLGAHLYKVYTPGMDLNQYRLLQTWKTHANITIYFIAMSIMLKSYFSLGGFSFCAERNSSLSLSFHPELIWKREKIPPSGIKNTLGPSDLFLCGERKSMFLFDHQTGFAQSSNATPFRVKNIVFAAWHEKTNSNPIDLWLTIMAGVIEVNKKFPIHPTCIVLRQPECADLLPCWWNAVFFEGQPNMHVGEWYDFSERPLIGNLCI